MMRVYAGSVVVVWWSGRYEAMEGERLVRDEKREWHGGRKADGPEIAAAG